jgi:hypothetical protein
MPRISLKKANEVGLKRVAVYDSNLYGEIVLMKEDGSEDCNKTIFLQGDEWTTFHNTEIYWFYSRAEKGDDISFVSSEYFQ